MGGLRSLKFCQIVVVGVLGLAVQSDGGNVPFLLVYKQRKNQFSICNYSDFFSKVRNRKTFIIFILILCS